MNAIHPISRERHGTKRWKNFSDYRFAATRTVAPLAGAEIAKAVLVFPLAFVKVGDTWSMAAVLGLTPGQNLFVAPTGQWAGSYIPAAFRGYPFQIAQTQAGQYTLCVDESSGLVVDGPEGTPFFDESGNPSEPVRQALDFLLKTAQSGEALSRACGALAQQGVVEPWPITIRTGDQERPVAGLHRINEAALNSLSDEGFLALRQAGALPMAYAQLLSMSNLATLGRLADMHRQARAQIAAQAQAAAATQTLDLDRVFSLSESGTVDWSTLSKPE